MLTRVMRRLLAFLAVLGLGIAATAIAAENTGHHRVETGYYQRVRGLDIYYGVVPAEIAGRHPSIHEEGGMHGGAPKGKREYHLVVAPL
jgi:hypothetical protein